MPSSKLLSTIKNNNIEFVAFRFTDLQGKVHQITWLSSQIDEKLLESGIVFDGSSIQSWKEIHHSDTVLKPDLSTYFMDQFATLPTLNLICDVFDPLTGKNYNRDPRSIAQAAEHYLKKSGIGDVANFGPEMEFFILDHVKFENSPNRVCYEYDSEEGPYNNARDYEGGNLSHRPDFKGGYAPIQPIDKFCDIRAEMCKALQNAGLAPTLHHHEVAASQCEIGFMYSSLITAADNVQKFKEIAKNVAATYGKTVTFMPKPVFGDNGSGMHTHQSLWQGGKNLFFAEGTYANLSELCLYYIGGIIKHAKAINAFTNQATNSYKRLIPGYEAPVSLAYSANNRSAAIRIPYTPTNHEKAKRIEVRFPDPLANPYLSFSALLMAGLDGIRNKIHPGLAVDKNLYHLSQEEAAKIGTVSRSLRESLENLDRDRAFLLEGGVFSNDFIDNFIDMKMHEVHAWETAPHPIEYKMYFNN